MNFKKLLSILLLGTVLSFSTITAEEVGQEYELTGITDYDENGNIIYEKNDENECWYEYDSTGKLIRSRNNVDGSETTYDYDPKGNLIHAGSDQGYDCWYSYTFWENGKPKTRKEYSIQRDVDF